MTATIDTMTFPHLRKVMSLDALARECARLRAAGVAVAAAGGCFDLLHVGHVRTLCAARAQGDRLIVMLNSDASVRRLKGPARPVMAEEARAEILAALQCVDYVVLFEEDSPAGVLARLQPAVFCKGEDYAPPNGKPLPACEQQAVAAYGGRIAYLPLVPDNSTTTIVGRIRESGQPA